MSPYLEEAPGTQFTCFTSTKVQILTQKEKLQVLNSYKGALKRLVEVRAEKKKRRLVEVYANSSDLERSRGAHRVLCLKLLVYKALSYQCMRP
jgi:hypothetical protein